MDSELMIAVVGGGGALLGAAVGGAAAVVSASIQGKRTAEAGRSAYQGALDVARRTAQQQAYSKLLSAANAYEAETGGVLNIACELIQELSVSLSGDLPSLSEEIRQQYRSRIEEARNPLELRAAVRYVGLEGPEIVYRAAKQVHAVVLDLSRVLGSVEETIDHGEGHWTPVVQASTLLQTHRSLRGAIDGFADTASAHLNGAGDG
ncbi:hypothetical protein OIC43_37225 [Streptomyces sp. NBC_00825]|uniref:hypothetical protein n=1 Tax=unclassified Streptomyces TaxID=2593676 RepID=UPI002ED0BB2A|nr:hypothetical protein OG832_06465 [Streptomyces sp. NBC_00826]WTH94280.1 hypothetical protein OIC43_37225 [Streptomyces sp. NBC_00825]WTI03015.1 hypothetical protein OHA23_37205 [Streptomyces sp. NBC_00822]